MTQTWSDGHRPPVGNREGVHLHDVPLAQVPRPCVLLELEVVGLRDPQVCGVVCHHTHLQVQSCR